MPPKSKAAAPPLPPMAEESTSKLLPALAAQLNNAQKSASGLKLATTVCALPLDTLGPNQQHFAPEHAALSQEDSTRAGLF